MPFVERTDEEIVAAFKRWVERLPQNKQNEVILVHLCERKNNFTSRDLLNEMENKSELGIDLLDALRKMAKVQNLDPVETIDNDWK